jgi:RNA polymerase sigma factor (sigma-70 family)
MANGSAGAVARQIKTLWEAGVIGAADDSALIACYSARRDERAEAAFRVLVERHGPMVLRACRQVLGDGPDAHDSAQAVFLVLARRAGSIRSRGSIAPWLHEVACRVASRARQRAAVRRTNEARVVSARGQAASGPTETFTDWEAIHEEVARLPEKYRAPVVLCYLEGQTYEEVSRRLGCPVGTVRVRLSRARDRLRDRLARRGFGPTPLVPVAPGEALPTGWIESAVRAAQAFSATRAAEAGAVSTSTLVLTQGVLRSMMLTKLKVAACVLLASGVLAAGGQALVGQVPAPKPTSPGEASKAAVPAPVERSKAAAPAPVDRERELILRRLELARQRLEAQRAFYEKGRITVDRYFDASSELKEAEILAATTNEQRIAAVMANLDRIKAIEAREKAELKAGRGAVADVAEATRRREQAELELLQPNKVGRRFELEEIERRLTAVEQKLDRIIKLLDIIAPGHGR